MDVKLLFFDSYLETIKKSIGTNIFQTLFAEVDGEKQDIIQNGEKACALFVSGVLQWFGLAEARHATVVGLLKDMERSGWGTIQEPRVGCIIHWEEMQKNGEGNEHIGFYIGEEKAISNERDERTIIKHHWTYGEEYGKPVRGAVNLYWHSKLDNRYFL